MQIEVDPDGHGAGAKLAGLDRPARTCEKHACERPGGKRTIRRGRRARYIRARRGFAMLMQHALSDLSEAAGLPYSMLATAHSLSVSSVFTSHLAHYEHTYRI